MGLVEAMNTASTGSVSLDIMDSYKIALSESLISNSVDKYTTFCTANSRLVTCNRLPKDTYSELLIYSNFRPCASPESNLPRAHLAENTNVTSETQGQKVVLAGASNTKQSAARFNSTFQGCVDISTPGWTPTPGNVAKIKSNVER